MATKREEVKDRLSTQILEAAVYEFTDKGYAGATLRNIAERAGVSNGVISKYFETKEGLLVTILEMNTLEGIFKDLESEEPEDIFNCYIDFVRKLQVNRGQVFRFYYNIFKDTQLTGAPDRIVSAYLWEEFRGSRLEKAIVRAQEEGDLPQGEPLQIYRLLVHITMVMLESYEFIGMPAPDNSFILNAIRFRAGGEQATAAEISPESADISSILREQEERKTQEIIKGFTEEYDASFCGKISDNSYHVFSDKDVIEQQIRKYPTYTDAMRAYVSYFAHPDDQQLFEGDFIDLQSAKKNIPIGESRTLEFRSRSGGEYAWYRSTLRRITEDEVLLGFKNCDTEITNKIIAEQLVKDYDALYTVDLNLNRVRPARPSKVNPVGNFSKISDYTPLALKFSETLNSPYKEDWIKFSDRAYMKQYMADEDHREYIYELPGAKNTIRRMTVDVIKRIDGEAAIILLSFMGIDEKRAQEIEAENREKHAMAVISAMAEDFEYICAVNTRTKKVTRYVATPKFYEVERTIDRSLPDSERLELFLRKVVHPSEIQRFAELASYQNIEAGLAENPVYKFECLTVSPEGKEEWYRFKFANMPDEPELRIMGMLNIDEIVRREQEGEAERQMNFDIIEILASEYSSVYYIDLTTDGLNPYTMNEDTESAFGKIFRSGIRYSEAYRMYVGELVLPEDKQMMLNAGSIGNIMQELKNKKTFITTYRSSEGHYSEMKFVKVGDEDGLPTAVALGFADKDDELRAREEESRILQRNIDIIEILASEYSSVYYIDLTTDELDPYTMNAETESEFGQIFRSGIKYSDAYKLYVDSLVYGEDRQMMLKAGSVYSILTELENKKTYLTKYRNENGEWCEMKFVKVGNERNPKAVALGFANKDVEIRNEMLRREKAERDMAVITGLSDDFGCVVYTGYDDKGEIHYRFDPLFEKHIAGWSQISDFGERLHTLRDTVVHPDDRQMFDSATKVEVVKAALKKSNAYYVNFRLLIDGEVVYYQAKFVRDPKHGDTNVIAGFHSVDAETKREMEALDKAEAANRAKTDFLFNMSHDIRTPMNAIIGFTNMAMKNTDNPEKLQDCLDKTQTAGNLLLSLVNSILDMSRIESGKAHLEEDKGDVMLSFVNIESTMHEMAKSRSIDLDMKVENITDRFVICDFTRCERVFINLISNAIKYTPEGGWVKVRGTQIEPATNGYGLYQYTVEDNGIGMSEEFKEHVFEEFTREKNSTVSGIQGTGLGLAVCKAFVTLMGGTIECESEQGKGSKFTVTVPFRLQEGREYLDPVSHATVNMDSDGSSVSLEGRRVLLVEDNELNREIAIDLLEDAGATVEEAEDGDVSVERLREKGPDYYDFILMDIQMPRMSGYEATKEIRRMYPEENIPIIAVSANAFEEDRRASIEAGMNAHVAKPIIISELLDTISEFL